MRKYLIYGLQLVLFSSAHAALTLENYQSELHDRFSGSSSFIGSNYDWSGVAQTQTPTSGSLYTWGTMISATYFISANHFHPTVGSSLTFYSNNSNSAIVREVASIQRIGTTDIVIGKLTSTPGSDITAYDIANTTVTNAAFSFNSYRNEEVFVVGKGATESSTTSFRVGRNRLSNFISDFDINNNGSVVGDAVTFNNDIGSASSLGDDEAYIETGDSGAPLFLKSANNTLTLVGINWFNTSDDSFSAASFLANYRDDIAAIVETQGGETLGVNAVPESTSPLFILLGGLLTCTLRFRR